MSSTTILKLNIGGKSEELRELRNSHGSAPVVWNLMCQKYFGTRPFSYSNDIERLWPLYKDMSISEHHRAVLMMTFDLAYVRKEHYARAASDIRKWIEDFPLEAGYVNHWPTIAEIYESDPDCEAIGIYHTSVSENPFDGPWNEEEEEYDPIDWTGTYEIYDTLDGLRDKGVA